MPLNRNALIRYRTIDKCLQNRRRKWTIDDLLQCCTEALLEYEGIEKEVSMRTIRLDLNAMRSDKLGYNAPIIVTDRKSYSYEDPEYSIAKVPLSIQDLGILQEVADLLRQFKGFSHFNDVNEIVNKLEDKIYTEQYQKGSVIDFEKNELLTGIQWLDVLYKAIIAQTALQLSYQSFKARQANDFVVYPYLLKEYRNRWFILGMKRKGKELTTLALDRIKEVTLLKDEPFLFHEEFNADTYFSDIIGVTRGLNEKPTRITFFADHVQAPYIRTKPIHHSQQILDSNKEGVTFTIDVIHNFELERELMGFGEGLRILSPNDLVRRIKKKVRLMHQNYYPGEKEK